MGVKLTSSLKYFLIQSQILRAKIVLNACQSVRRIVFVILGMKE